jgi:hypothetical protein
MQPELPDPLTPADCDLRGMGWMPMHGDRMFDSDTWIRASSDSARIWMLRIWWKSWKCVPAGSLPNDERFLATTCGIVDIRVWRRNRGQVLRGFVLCSDGRLYHPVVCEEARVSWDKRIKAKTKKAAQREAWSNRENAPKAGGKRSESDPKAIRKRSQSDSKAILKRLTNTQVSNENSDLPAPVPGDVPPDNTRQYKTRHYIKKEDKGSPSARRAAPPPAQPDMLPSADVAPIGVVDEIQEAVRLWNAMAAANGLAQAQSITDTRRRTLRARLREAGGLEGWKACLEIVADTPFLLGLEGNRTWSADFDFVIRSAIFTKIMEGGYRRGPAPRAESRHRGDTNAEMFAAAGLGPDGRLHHAGAVA